MSLSMHTRYKESGLGWLGVIPEHWTLRRLGFECETVVPMRDKPANLGGEIPWIRIEDFDGKVLYGSKSGQGVTHDTVREMNLKVLPAGAVLCSCSCQMGATAIVGTPLVTNQTFIGIIPGPAFDSNYLYYFLQHAADHLNSLGTGAIQTYLSRDDFRQLRLPCPPILEQSEIAAFLDRETNKIDVLIAEQQRLIGFLTEKRQAVISHGVTKGLNPKASMKDSCVEWIGTVPAHWDVKRLKNMMCKITDGEHISPILVAEGIPLLSAKDVRDWKLDYEVDKFVNVNDANRFWKRCKPQLGDILVVSRGATVGRVGVVESELDFCLMGSVILCKPRGEFTSAFLYYALNAKHAQTAFWFSSASSAQQAIYIRDVADVPVPTPPASERTQIAEFLSTEVTELDELTSESETAILLLQERRTALISAAVTGKIDVRQAVGEVVA